MERGFFSEETSDSVRSKKKMRVSVRGYQVSDNKCYKYKKQNSRWYLMIMRKWKKICSHISTCENLIVLRKDFDNATNLMIMVYI